MRTESVVFTGEEIKELFPQLKRERLARWRVFIDIAFGHIVPTERELVLMYRRLVVLESHTYKEAATTLGINPSTLFRGNK